MQIVDEIDHNDNDYDYVEMTVEEYINKCGLTYEEKCEFIKKIFSINIHMMISKESLDQCYEVINDRLSDTRLEKLNAIVFLSLKQKGRGKVFNTVTNEEFKNLIEYALERDVAIGFDSCSCHKFLNAVSGHPQYEQFKTLSEPCESSCFSIYFSAEGKYYPCSFCEGVGDWKDGLDIKDCKDFLKDIWFHQKTNCFRKSLLENNRHCPIYTI